MGQFTEEEYKESVHHIIFREKADFVKIEKTLVSVWNFMTDVSVIVIKDGKVISLKWFNLMAYYKLSVAAYKFITEVVEIWKK
jgi:hypothetical protein